MAVVQNPLALKFVDPRFQTENLCKLAVEQNGLALQYVHEKYRTYEIHELAIKQNAEALRYIPYYLQSSVLHHITRSSKDQEAPSNTRTIQKVMWDHSILTSLQDRLNAQSILEPLISNVLSM